MAAGTTPVSFYLFDFDDNIMFLTTPIFIIHSVTREEKVLSTGEYAQVHPFLGKPGAWEDYAEFEGTFRHFRDIPASELRPGQKQYFVQDVEAAVTVAGDVWKAPSWDLLVYACEKQRPISLVTARGHSPETLKDGVRVLVERGLLPREPNYHTIFPVGNDEVRREQLGDEELQMTTPALKKVAIIQSVELALQQYGHEPAHHFGMSDDDPANVNLIITAMCDCKTRYADKHGQRGTLG